MIKITTLTAALLLSISPAFAQTTPTSPATGATPEPAVPPSPPVSPNPPQTENDTGNPGGADKMGNNGQDDQDGRNGDDRMAGQYGMRYHRGMYDRDWMRWHQGMGQMGDMGQMGGMGGGSMKTTHFELRLGSVNLQVDCGDEPMKACIDASKPLIDAAIAQGRMSSTP